VICLSAISTAVLAYLYTLAASVDLLQQVGINVPETIQMYYRELFLAGAIVFGVLTLGLFLILFLYVNQIIFAIGALEETAEYTW
jgi:hypothetical protein